MEDIRDLSIYLRELHSVAGVIVPQMFEVYERMNIDTPNPEAIARFKRFHSESEEVMSVCLEIANDIDFHLNERLIYDGFEKSLEKMYRGITSLKAMLSAIRELGVSADVEAAFDKFTHFCNRVNERFD